MSPNPPPLTDRAAIARNRARTRQEAMFLHHAARAEVEDRLDMVNKSFTDVGIVTGHPAIWQNFGGDPRIVPDSDTLDLKTGAHDLVIHAMCLHWSNDPVGQLIQCRRALRPDGLLLAILPGGRTLHELRSALAEAETRASGGLSPRVLPFGDIRDLGALLQRAGFALPVADSLDLTVEYGTLTALMHDLRHMGEGNALHARNRRVPSRHLFSDAERVYAAHYPGRQKRLSATFQLVILTGWAPDSSQPQPLRPGSARARLSDALGTDETPLPD